MWINFKLLGYILKIPYIQTSFEMCSIVWPCGRNHQVLYEFQWNNLLSVNLNVNFKIQGKMIYTFRKDKSNK